MKCKKPNGVFTTVTWKLFYAACKRFQIANGTCNALSKGYVAAVTVCNQQLF